MLADVNLAELPEIALIALQGAIAENYDGVNTLAYLSGTGCQRRAEMKVQPPIVQHSTIPAAFPVRALAGDYKKRLVYLPRLLAQDWSLLFAGSDTVVTDSYVYMHCDPRSKPIELKSLKVNLKGKPFYIGKGSGRRAWDLKRNEGHGKRIQGSGAWL